MSKWSATLQCGAVGGVALLLASPSGADDALRETIRKQLRDASYVLVEDRHGARLFVFSEEGGGYRTTLLPAAPGSPERALAMTQSELARERVLGLTTLAGEPGEAALNAALVLLSDPDPAVREEAVNLILDHPDGSVDTIASIVIHDPSSRVREVMEDYLDDEVD